jgi:hypothetical protein
MKEESLISKILKRRDIVFLLGIAILVLLLMKQCNSNKNLKNQIDINNHNIDALNDTVRVEKDKLNREVYVKRTLLATNKNLKDLNEDLSKEVNLLKGKVIYLQTTETKVVVDTQYINNYITLHPDGNYSLDWGFDTTYSAGNYRRLSGNSFFSIEDETGNIIPGKTRINQDEMGFSFITGLREKNKSLEIFVTPKYPGMVVTDIEGAIIDPNKSELLKKMFPEKRWGIGPQLGIGIGGGYNINGTPAFGPMLYFGVGVNYSLIRF